MASSNSIIHFYACRNKYGCFSNFKLGKFMMDGVEWRSAEHWFQAQKYAGTEHVERIRLLKRAQEAFDEGQRTDLKGKRSYKEWEATKRDVVKAKFTQREVFRKTLLDTGNLPIAEHCEDKVWGDGKDGTGLNLLGKILMQVRDELANETTEPANTTKKTKKTKSTTIEPTKKPKSATKSAKKRGNEAEDKKEVKKVKV